MESFCTALDLCLSCEFPLKHCCDAEQHVCSWIDAELLFRKHIRKCCGELLECTHECLLLLVNKLHWIMNFCLGIGFHGNFGVLG
jgi:hypothetical protein